MLAEVRIEADPEIVVGADADIIAEYSADSSLVFLPFRIRDDQVVDPFGSSMGETLFLLPVTAMVMAAEDIDLDAEPEEGEAGEKAEASDALEDAARKAADAAKAAADAVEAAEKARKRVEKMKADPDGVDPEAEIKAEKIAKEAEKQAVEKARKAAKATAKAQTASREAEASGIRRKNPGKNKPLSCINNMAKII